MTAAAQQVGPTGLVVGVDMTTDMVRLATRNAKVMKLNNVVFKKRFQDFIFKKGRCVKICYKSVLYSLFFVHRL